MQENSKQEEYTCAVSGAVKLVAVRCRYMMMMMRYRKNEVEVRRGNEGSGQIGCVLSCLLINHTFI